MGDAVRFWMIFGAVLTVMHLVIWAQARRHLHLGPWVSILALAASLALALFSVSIQSLPETWPPSVTIPIWWMVYFWLALAIFLFLSHLAVLVLEGVLALFGSPAAALLRTKTCFFAVLAFSCLVVTYGTQEAAQVRVLTKEIVSAKVKKPLRIVAVSDIHLGALNLNGRLKILANRINDLEPDVVAFVGDIVNDHTQWLGTEAAVLAGIKAPLKVGVFGNHERYVGDAVSASIFDRSGIILLRDAALTRPEWNLRVLGVDDPGRSTQVTEDFAQSIRTAAQGLTPDEFSLLLIHRPLDWKEVAVPLGIDLTLSGHTHGGQMFPFTLIVNAIYEFPRGFYDMDGKHLAVSSGAGYWGPPIRVLAPPDIILVDVKPAK